MIASEPELDVEEMDDWFNRYNIASILPDGTSAQSSLSQTAAS